MLIKMYLTGLYVRRVEDITDLSGEQGISRCHQRAAQKAYTYIENWYNLPQRGKCCPNVYVD